MEQTITPVRDGAGQIRRFVATARNVTAHRRLEAELGLLRTLTLAICEAADVEDAIGLALRRVCDATRWTYGEAWVPRPDGSCLDASPAWYCSRPELKPFRAASARYTFAPGAGLPGRVWATKQPAWLPDATLDAAFARAAMARAAELRAAVAVPILAGDEVAAVLAFFASEPQIENARLVALVAAAAAPLGPLVQRRRAEAALQESNRRLGETVAALEGAQAQLTKQLDTIRLQAARQTALSAFARTVSSRLDLDSVLDLITRQVPALLECGSCAVLRADFPAGHLVLLAQHRTDGVPADPPGSLRRMAESAAGMAARRGQVHVVEDCATSDLPWVRYQATRALRSLISVPIRQESTLWGVLNVGFAVPLAGGQEQADLVAFLEAIASQLAVAIHNAQLYGDLQEAHQRLQASQQQVVQQERLRALGEMASGIAHDFNNALAPIVGFSELLLLRLGELGEPADREPFPSYLQLIHTAAQDAANVVRRLRAFYRPHEAGEPFTAVGLNALVAEVVSLTQPKWKDEALAAGRTIRLVTDLHEIPPVPGGEAELREALTNLVFNAVDAVPDGGTITLRTRAEAGWATVEVADTGTGMPEEVRRRCLEPFFTTKGERGSGLGLAMVHGTVRRHRGSLAIESAPGRGTTVRLRLPVQATPPPGDPLPEDAGSPRGLRVLVVDDEPAIRGLLAAFLTGDGHAVETAADGREAWERFQAGCFDLVLTDRAMPGLNGEQLAAAIEQAAPATPVILLTGYGDLMQSAGERPPGVDRIVAKPVTLAALRAAIAAVVR